MAVAGCLPAGQVNPAKSPVKVVCDRTVKDPTTGLDRVQCRYVTVP